MGVREVLYDILDYVADRKCDGNCIAADICERLDGVNSNYELTLRIHISNGLIFTETYPLEYADLCHLDTTRKKVDGMIQDFCNKYKNMKK